MNTELKEALNGLTGKQMVGAFIAGLMLIGFLIPKTPEQKAADQAARAKAQVEEVQRKKDKAALDAKIAHWNQTPAGKSFHSCRSVFETLRTGASLQETRITCGQLHGFPPGTPPDVMMGGR